MSNKNIGAEKTARDLVQDESGVTVGMITGAEYVVRQLRLEGPLGKLLRGRQMTVRDLLWELLRAAKLVQAAGELTEVVKDEEGWRAHFKSCRVLVKDEGVMREIIKASLDDPAVFTEVIGSVAQNGALVVPLQSYPGVSLFTDSKKRKVKSEGDKG